MENEFLSMDILIFLVVPVTHQNRTQSIVAVQTHSNVATVETIGSNLAQPQNQVPVPSETSNILVTNHPIQGQCYCIIYSSVFLKKILVIFFTLHFIDVSFCLNYSFASPMKIDKLTKKNYIYFLII